MPVSLQRQLFVPANWAQVTVSNGIATVGTQFAFGISLTGTLTTGATVTGVESAINVTQTLTVTGLGASNGFVLQDSTGANYLFSNAPLSVGNQVAVSAAGLNTYTVPPRTLIYTGTTDTNVGNAANYNDTTNLNNPAALAPVAADTVQFLTNGGTLTGSDIAGNLLFNGLGGWSLASGATLTAANAVTVGSGSLGEVIVNAGATLAGLGASDVISGGTAASVVVSGAGARWSSAGELYIGLQGTGMMTINAQGTTTASGTAFTPAVSLGTASGGQGSLLVSGTAAKLAANGALYVGQSGVGHLRIENHGTAQTGGNALDPTEGVDIAAASGGAGDATVSGSTSLLTNTGGFIVGDAGLGSLSIQAGGTVITAPGAVTGLAGAVIGNTAAAAGSQVTVSGPGSVWSIGGDLVVGKSGLGFLSVTQGATVGAVSLDEGALAGGGGVITVAGSNTVLGLTGNLFVGDKSTGELSITGGAVVNVGFSVIVDNSAGSSGNIDIEGTGSHLLVTGTTVNGVYYGGNLSIGVNGPGVLTIGNGATLSVFNNITIGKFGRIDNFGGVTDPFTATIQSGTTSTPQSLGNIGSTLFNDGVLDATQTNSFLAPVITHGSTGTQTGVIQIESGVNLIVNTNTIDTSQTVVFVDTTGTLTIGQVLTPGSPGNPSTLTPGAASALPNFHAAIKNYLAGDKILFNNLTVGSDTVGTSNGVVTLFSGPGGTGTNLGTLSFVNSSGGADTAGATAAAAQIAPCYAAGTRIETPDGPRAVESLAAGDTVVTLLGGPGRIVWAGARTVDCAKHPRPETVWPVRIAADAFGEGLPARDLFVSPDHAIYVEGVLVPARHLLNGSTVRQVKRARVTYHHIELERHDVVLAEGLPAESYLDTGDRARFAGGAVVTLHPDFAARTWEMQGCADLVVRGEKLDAARARCAPRQMPAAKRRMREERRRIVG